MSQEDKEETAIVDKGEKEEILALIEVGIACRKSSAFFSFGHDKGRRKWREHYGYVFMRR